MAMASGDVLKKFQTHYHALESCVNDWDTIHDALLRLIGTYGNICERLPSLMDTDAYGTLWPEVEGIVEKLVGSQADRLAGVYAEMKASVVDVEDVCRRMRSIYRRASGFVQQEARLLRTQNRTAAKASPVPRVEECLEGIDRIVTMFERETRVCRVLVWGMGLKRAHVFQSWMRGQHCIDRDEVVKRIHVMKASIEDTTMKNV